MRGEEGYGEEGYTVVGREHYTADPGKGAVGVALTFLIGVLAGAGLALVLAPQSGLKTRRLIKEASSGAREMVGAWSIQTAEKLGVQVARGKALVREGKPLLMAALEAGKDAFEKERGERLGAGR
jgi:gas vesicle protein